jgi:hypothetical protein
MAVEMIMCPSCQHKLRIPRELFGQPVQCPDCGVEFIAPPPPAPQDTGSPAASPGFPGRDRGMAPQGFDSEGPDDVDSSASRSDLVTTCAGVALIAVSILGVLVNLLRLFMAFSPNMMKMAIQNNPLGPMPNNIDPKLLFLATGCVFGLISIAGIAGGAAIVRRRNYFLAVIGSVTALLNVGDCCCLLSGPVGIACLIMLFQAQVQKSFH